MSYLNINPANAPVIAQVSGSTFISTSGSVTAVVIGGSIGTGTFADVHSSIGDDAVSTSTDTLATSAYIYGFHSGNQQWARIGAQIMASGGGFGLQTSTVIRDHNIPNNKARVLNNTAFAAIATEDDALLTVSQVLGYDQTVSGYQALQVTSSGKLISGAQHKLIIDFSGAIAQIGASGSARTANVNRYGFDDGSVNDNRLLTSAALQAFNVVDNEVNRLQVLPISSGTTNTTIPTSGHPLYTASVIVDASDGFTLDIDDALESDTEPTARNRVRVQSVIQAFNEQTSGITRIRGIAVSSGMDSTPGVRMPFSGYFLGTASLIIGRDGSAINVNDPDDDSYGPNDGGLVTKSILYGYNRTENVFSRVPVTASGQGTSGMQHRLGVAFSGDVVQIGEGGNIVDVQSSTLSDAVSTADNSLTTMALGYAFHEMTGVSSGWSRLRSMVPTSGKGFALMTKPAEPVTYSVITPTITISSGRQFLAIYMTSGTRKVKIKAAHIHARSNLTSGQLVFMALTKITTNPLSGTALSATQFDETDEESGVSLTIKHTVTNIPDASTAQNLRIMPMTNQATINNIGAFSSGTATVILPNQFANSLNLADWGEGIKPFTLTSGVGVSIMQETTTTVTSGGFVAQIVYTLEDD